MMTNDNDLVALDFEGLHVICRVDRANSGTASCVGVLVAVAVTLRRILLRLYSPVSILWPFRPRVNPTGNLSLLAAPAIRMLTRECMSYAWWQMLLRFVNAAAVAGGAAGLLSAGYYAIRGRPYRSGRNPRSMAVVSLALLVAGSLSFWLTRSLAEPAQSRVVTTRRFSSSIMPAFDVEAPDGWRIEFNQTKSLVNVIKGPLPFAKAPAVLMLGSSIADQDVTLDQMMVEMKAAFESTGLTVEAPFQEMVSGKPSIGFLARGPNGIVANWIVKRGARLVGSLQCVARDGTDPRQACAAPLARLQWQTPTNVDPHEVR